MTRPTPGSPICLRRLLAERWAPEFLDRGRFRSDPRGDAYTSRNIEAIRGFVARLTHGLELSAAVAEIHFVTFRGLLKFVRVLREPWGRGRASQPDEHAFSFG
jgi:hypothetical protein